jgi:hypothetical protein
VSAATQRTQQKVEMMWLCRCVPSTVGNEIIQSNGDISPKWQKAGLSASAHIVNSLPLDNMVWVVTVVQQFMTEYKDAVQKKLK